DSGFLRSELAITTWLRLAREAGCAQLFNSPVSHIHHDDNGVTLGFRQLANSRWPATPLYCLSINSAELAKTIAGDGVLNVRL
ncbi:virulence factor SrfB, partial [Salmonella enterica subsp. enterica serovar Anatum]|nr:virulence factor SrfB [Salmonella enterica subsp. enterica serovar Anatum]